MNNQLTGDTPQGPTTGHSVFVAPVISDLEILSRNVRLDLEQHGIHVRSLTQTAPVDLKTAVSAQLQGTSLSIHLLESASFQPTHTVHSGDLETLGFALEHSKVDPRFQILVWTPKLREDDPTEQLVIQLIRKHHELSANTEVVESHIEDFKSLVLDRIESMGISKASDPLPATEPHDENQIYVIYDQQDREAAQPVLNFLGDRGIGILQAPFQGEQRNMREVHNEYLRKCDGALIIYGKVREPWLRMKQQDLLRSAALGRVKRLAAKAVWLSPVVTEDKLRFQAPDMMVIDGSSSITALEPFLTRVATS